MSGSDAIRLQNRGHRLDAVDQPVVHVDVDDLGSVVDLLAGDIERGRVVVLLDETAETRRPGDVRALADVDERDVVGECERLQAAELETRRARGNPAGCLSVDRLRDRGDVLRRGSAASADDVHQPGFGELAEESGGRLRGLVVLPELVRQTGVRIDAHQRVRHRRDLGEVGSHLRRSERAIQADGQRRGVPNRLPERRRRLSGQRATRPVGDRAGDHQRDVGPTASHHPPRREDGGLGVQRVEDRLDHQRIDTTVEQAVDLLVVRVGDVGEGHGSVARVLDARRDRERHVGRSDGTRDEPPHAIPAGRLVRCFAGDARRREVDVAHVFDRPVVSLRDARRREGVGLDDVGAGEQVAQVDLAHRVGLGQHQQVVVAGEITGMRLEAFAAEGHVVEAECPGSRCPSDRRA